MLSYNIEGFRRNNSYLTNLLDSESPSVIFLQEIWMMLADQNSINSLSPNYSFSISTPDMVQNTEDLLSHQNHSWHGVAIGWRNDLSSHILPLKSECHRIAGIKLGLSSGNLLLVSFYAPTSGHDDDFLESMSNLSDFIKSNSSPSDYVAIGADANCSVKSSLRRRDAWKNFCDTHNLTIHLSPQPSFHHHNGSSSSYIDLFAVTSSIKMSKVSQICTLEDPLNLSSHDPVFSEIKVNLVQASCDNKYSKTYSDFDRKRIHWDASKISAYEDFAEHTLQKALTFFNSPETIPVLSSLIPKLLVQSALCTLKSRSLVKKSTGTKSSKRVKHAEQEMKWYFNRWKKDGKPNSYSVLSRKLYVDARSNLQKLKRQEENFSYIRQHNNLMRMDNTNRSQMVSMLKRYRGVSSQGTTSTLHTPTGTYHGDDVLEGFAADAEHLGKMNNEAAYDRGFYKLCKLDNIYIFEIMDESNLRIPPMTIGNLNKIIFSKMKLGKACDIYHLTVEHLRYCGDSARKYVLSFINMVLDNINYLSCPQIKLGVGTAVYKGKNKPKTSSNSYRRITVSPIIGAIIDYYVDPIAEATFRLQQSPDQLGFTMGVSYLLAAIQRGECQRWAIDQKMTCFGVSLDGESAFPSVERSIQIRQLYSGGEREGILAYSKNTYENTECHLKLHGKLSRKIQEYKGNRQGHVRASGHFKAYINPCLLSLGNSNLGFPIGTAMTTVVCVADDVYLLSNTPHGLQGSLDIMSHYANRHQLSFNADKTKIVVTGSKQDMLYYKETSPWTLNGKKISVVDNNDHLGIIVSGLNEEQKNVDQNIVKCRTSMFSLLGQAFAYKCMLSPIAQVHIWRICNLPVLLSGLAALPIRPTNIKALDIFHRKVLRGFLKLSQTSPVPSLYFLLGELPMEGILHLRTLGLFYNLWSNPHLSVHSTVKYILKMCPTNSTTWSNHLRLICQQYCLPCPLQLIQSPPWPKELWTSHVKTKVTVWHENHLRSISKNNSKMSYLNTNLLGLSGRPHPALLNISSTQDVKKLRPYLKFLTCDVSDCFLASDSNNRCLLCLAECSIEHVLASCPANKSIKERLLPTLLNIIANVQPQCALLKSYEDNTLLVQFILDCTSLNLPEPFRIPAHNPEIVNIFEVSRDWCYATFIERSRQLKSNYAT